MTTLTMRSIIPHGVVFLYDPTMIVDVPEDTGSAPILYTNTCVSIWTVQEDDGEVLLTLSDDIADAYRRPVFEGIVETEGRRLAFNESGVNSILEIGVSGTLTKVSLFTNHSFYPDSVTCLIHPDSAQRP